MNAFWRWMGVTLLMLSVVAPLCAQTKLDSPAFAIRETATANTRETATANVRETATDAAGFAIVDETSSASPADIASFASPADSTFFASPADTTALAATDSTQFASPSDSTSLAAADSTAKPKKNDISELTEIITFEAVDSMTFSAGGTAHLYKDGKVLYGAHGSGGEIGHMVLDRAEEEQGPCGNYGAQGKVCTCSKKQVENYLGKISRPVLDRIDIQVEVPSVKYEELSGAEKSESSEIIAERVEKARDIRLERFRGTDIRTNSQITPDLLHEVCVMDEQAGQFLKNAFEKSGLSARAYDRILKVARTCADLDGAEIIGKRHIARRICEHTEIGIGFEQLHTRCNDAVVDFRG